MSKFLDSTGLSYAVTKIKDYIDDNNVNIYYISGYLDTCTLQLTCPASGTFQGFYLVNSVSSFLSSLSFHDIVLKISNKYYLTGCFLTNFSSSWSYDIPELKDNSIYINLHSYETLLAASQSNDLYFYKDSKIRGIGYDVATIYTSGLMSASDKQGLNKLLSTSYLPLDGGTMTTGSSIDADTIECESMILETNLELQDNLTTYNYGIHSCCAENTSYFTCGGSANYKDGLYFVTCSYFGDGLTMGDLIMVKSYNFCKLIDNSCTTITQNSPYNITIAPSKSSSTITVYKITM